MMEVEICKTCKAPVNMSPPFVVVTKCHPHKSTPSLFYRADDLPVAQPTVSKNWRELLWTTLKISMHFVAHVCQYFLWQNTLFIFIYF